MIFMTTGRIGVGVVFFSWLLMGTFASVAAGGEGSADVGTNRTATKQIDAIKLIERMDRLEERVTDLETQVVTLKREKTAAERSLRRQEEADSALRSEIARKTASAAELSSQVEPVDPREDRPRRDLISAYGVRAGYQGFPFGQKEGGFFYGFFIDHLLASESDGVPGGDLDFELGAGVARSGNDEITVNSAVVGAPTKVDFRQRMISIWPALKYRYDQWQSYGLTPYLTGGPGVWVDIIETPPLVGGLQFPTKEIGERKIPATAGAGLFEGAQGGAGFELSLARLPHPVFARMKLGFDYRYSAWTTGQRFSTYSLLLSYRD
jgi:hypothetical protein